MAYVRSVEQLVIDVLDDLGLSAGRLDDYPGVWIDADGPNPRKICAIGVRLTRGRTLHGFALNVDPDMEMFTHIVPCGIPDKPVTSLRAEGIVASMAEVVDRVVARAVERWGTVGHDRHDVTWRHVDTDLAPFSRGEGPGVAAGTRPTRGREAGTGPRIDERAAAEGTSVRLLGQARRRRGRPGPGDRRAQARMDAGQGPHR